MTAQDASQSGPLHFEWPPTPDTLAACNRVLPGGADRLLALAERTQREQHEAVMERLREDRLNTLRGVTLALGQVAVAALATWFEHALVAVVFGTAALASVAATTVQGPGMRPPGSRTQRPATNKETAG